MDSLRRVAATAGAVLSRLGSSRVSLPVKVPLAAGVLVRYVAERVRRLGPNVVSAFVCAARSRHGQLPGRVGQTLLIGMGVAWVSGAVGLPEVTALLAGVVAGTAAWRSRRTVRAGPPDLEDSRPNFVLGNITSAPLQAAPIFATQPFWLGLYELERHATVIGTTGSGKTTTLARVANADISLTSIATRGCLQIVGSWHVDASRPASGLHWRRSCLVVFGLNWRGVGI